MKITHLSFSFIAELSVLPTRGPPFLSGGSPQVWMKGREGVFKQRIIVHHLLLGVLVQVCRDLSTSLIYLRVNVTIAIDLKNGDTLLDSVTVLTLRQLAFFLPPSFLPPSSTL